MRPQSFRSPVPPPLPRAVGKLRSRPVAGAGALLRRGLLRRRVKSTRRHPKGRGKKGAVPPTEKRRGAELRSRAWRGPTGSREQKADQGEKGWESPEPSAKSQQTL